jgi:hypothetical protein
MTFSYSVKYLCIERLPLLDLRNFHKNKLNSALEIFVDDLFIPEIQAPVHLTLVTIKGGLFTCIDDLSEEYQRFSEPIGALCGPSCITQGIFTLRRSSGLVQGPADDTPHPVAAAVAATVTLALTLTLTGLSLTLTLTGLSLTLTLTGLSTTSTSVCIVTGTSVGVVSVTLAVVLAVTLVCVAVASSRSLGSLCVRVDCSGEKRYQTC